MHERRRSARGVKIAAVLVLAAVVMAVGAVIYVARARNAAMSSLRVSAVRIVRTSDYPQNGILPFDKTIRDAAQAQRLYDALIALPKMPSGTYNCPADLGVAYHFTFYQGAAVATAMVKPDGCQGATLPDGSYRWAATDQTFWQVFEEVTGIPASNLIGLPPCSRPPTMACAPAPTITPPP